MSHLNEIDDNINELIMSKSFDRLTDAEKTKALEYAGSEEEYNSLRQTLLAITSSFNEEGDEEFAGDEVKNDLMSQFEKKYGTSGNRTKVVPMYRKPYFQLAVAASLALIFFLSFPLLRQSDKTGTDETQLAKTEKNAEPKTSTNGSATTAVTGGNNVDLGTKNKPDIGSAVAEDQQELKEETKGDDDSRGPGTGLFEKSLADEPKTEKSEEKKVSALSDLRKEQANGSYSWTFKEQNENATGFTNTGNTAPIVNLEKEKNAEQDKDVAIPAKISVNDELSANQKADRQKSEDSEKGKVFKEKAKEKNEYASHGSDHTRDLMNNTATIAAGNANARANISAELSGFVEQNKTEMLDLLFTVY